MATNRILARAAYWLSFPILLLLLYRPGIDAWFLADDFAWLSLDQQIHDWPSFWHILFVPLAQGTIRPLSERAFFVLSHHWFGVDALPPHVCGYLTACGAASLLAWIGRRLTGSYLAGWLAAAVWIVSCGLAVTISWVSSYNEILCVFLLLAAFSLRLRGVYWAEALVFLLGFGALEINVVYPAIALAWVLLAGVPARRGRDLRELAPLFLVSVVYFLIHAHFAPSQTAGPYAMHFDRSMASTVLRYWDWTLVAPSWTAAPHHPRALALSLAVVCSAGLAVAARFRPKVILFGLAWYLLTLVPLLPLRDHVTDYYLTIPAAGFALAVGAGITALDRLPYRGVGVAVIAAFLFVNGQAARATASWYGARAARVRTLVLGTVTAHAKHPGEAILLDGVDSDLYATSIAHSPLNLFGIADVYLTESSLDSIRTASNINSVSKYALPPGPTLRGLAQNRLEVYRLDGGRLRNVTTSYAQYASARLEDKVPGRVDVGNPLMAYLLGSEWYPLENGIRWMPRRVSLRLGGPSEGQNHLVLNGWCTDQAVKSGPVQLTVAVDGELLPPTTISKPETPFVRIFNVPASARGKQALLVRIEVSRTFRAVGDARDLGLAFGVVELAP